MPPESGDSAKDPNRFKFTSYRPSRGYKPFKYLQRLVVVLVAVALVVLIGRQVHHHYFAKSPTVAVAPTVQPAATKTPAPAKVAISASKMPSSLPNNGPGNTIGMFVGISLLAAGVHYVVSARRQSS